MTVTERRRAEADRAEHAFHIGVGNRARFVEYDPARRRASEHTVPH